MAELFGDRSFQAGLRASLAVVLLLAGFYLVYRAWGIFQPLIVSIFLSAALWPWVSRISSAPVGHTKWRPPRFLAAALIYATTLLSSALVVWMLLSGLLPQVDRLLAAYPQQTAFLQDYLSPFRSGDIAAGAAKVAGEVAGATSATPDGGQATGQAAAAVSLGALAIGLFGGMVTLILVLVFTFFLLLEGDRFVQWLLMTLPKEKRVDARTLGLEMRNRISQWVRAQITYAVVSALVMTIGMFVLQIPSPWFYGIVSAVLALLPGIGPAAAAVPAVFTALDMAPWQPAAVAIFGLVVYALDGTVLVPRIYGGVMQLPMFVVLVSTLLGADLMGVWGAMIATPVAVSLQIMLRALFRPPSTA